MKKAELSGSGKKKSIFREYLEAFLSAFVYALIILTFLVRPFKIPSGSMRPTLLEGDRILVDRFTYRMGAPERGDIAVFVYPDDPKKDYIKRVVGLPGDVVEIRDDALLVNGKPVEGPRFQGRHYFPLPENPYGQGPIKVPDGKLYVLGDNSGNSRDSRFWGFVPLPNLRGKAFLIYWPFRRIAIMI